MARSPAFYCYFWLPSVSLSLILLIFFLTWCESSVSTIEVLTFTYNHCSTRNLETRPLCLKCTDVKIVIFILFLVSLCPTIASTLMCITVYRVERQSKEQERNNGRRSGDASLAQPSRQRSNDAAADLESARDMELSTWTTEEESMTVQNGTAAGLERVRNVRSSDRTTDDESVTVPPPVYSTQGLSAENSDNASTPSTTSAGLQH
ncbi:MAG: hypothetical protein Q9224_005612 [Gallowayella concinna]